MPDRCHALTLVVVLSLLAGSGCRATRYKIGDALSPDWLKSQETKDRYHLHANNAQRFYQMGSDALLGERDPLKARRHFLQAEMQFRRAIEYEPYSFKAHLGAGYALLQQGTRPKLLEAIDFLEKANDLREGDARVPQGLCRVYLLLARHEGRVLDRLRAERARAHPARKLQLDRKILEAARRRKDDLEQAVRQGEAFLAAAPDKPWAHVFLGNAYAQLREDEKAIAHFERYIHLAEVSRRVYRRWEEEGVLPPGVTGTPAELRRKIRRNLFYDAEAKWMLNRIHYHRGDYLKAIEYIDRIYAENPDALPKYLPDRAQAKAKIGDYAGAVEDLDLFLKRLGRAGYEYDEIVREVMAKRRDYAAKIPGASPRPKTAGRTP